MILKKLVAGAATAVALVALSVVAGPAGPAQAQKPKDAETDGIVVMRWRHTSDGWNGLPESGGGPSSHIQDDPSQVYEFGQTNADGTVTTYGNSRVKTRD